MKAISFQKQGVRGFLHQPDRPLTVSLVLTHGAGSNCLAPLLVAVAESFCQSGVMVLRCDLAFRQQRSSGPPFPAGAAADREGLSEAVFALREISSGAVWLGGHSYGGRQASMLAAEREDLVQGLLLLSYPLHPPAKANQIRTAHWPKLRVPAFFVHGSKDPFGSKAELRNAIPLIPAPVELAVIDGAGHDLKRGRFDIQELVTRKALNFLQGEVVALAK